MEQLLYLLSLCLLVACLWAVISGKLFLGGQIVERDSERASFYLGLSAYVVIAVFAILFGRVI